MNTDTQKQLNSLFFSKFINLLIIDGKKLKAYKLFFKMIEFLNQKIEKQNIKSLENNSLFVLQIVETAILNCMPSLQVRKVRVAGTTYLVPALLAKKKQEALATRWIIEAAKKKKKSKSKDAEGGEAAGGDEEAEDLDDDLNLVSNILGSTRFQWLFLRPFCLQICSLYIRWLTL